jgi:hypothetical protein
VGFFEGLLAPRAEISVDDGGVRCVTARGGQYVPFASLADASVNIGALAVVLRLVGHDATKTTFRIASREALEVQEEILRGLAAVPKESIDESALAALARSDRPLRDWLARVSASARAADGYRGPAFDVDAARACLNDVVAHADLRAACAHALLATAQEDALAAVARAFVLRALPPLVVIAARLGRGGAALVPDGMLDDALRVLSPDDVASARAAISAPITHEDEAHVHALMDRVKVDALREASSHAPPARRKAFHARPLGGYAAEQGVSRFK